PLLQPALRDEMLRRFQRNVKGAAEAYLELSDDPEGGYARSRLPLSDFYRLMPGKRPAPPPAVTFELPPREARATPGLSEELDAALFETDRDEAERAVEALRLRYEKVAASTKTSLDAMIQTRCDTRGPQFAKSYSGKYQALGDAMSFLSNASQQRLLEC